MTSSDLEARTATDALLASLELRDPRTAEHCWRVAGYSRCFADHMTRGKAHPLDQERAAAIYTGALLHDVGKIGIGDRIMFKAGKLEPDEMRRMQEHPELGHKLVSRYPGLHAAAEVVRHHHERWDGAGYPAGLCGLQIPYYARIIALCDAFDAMTSLRPYGTPVGYEDAAERIARESGRQFDPELVKVFLAIDPLDWMAAGQ